MASLIGVKTLDMVNGEITKVEYNGAEYVKVDDKPQAGDLAFRNKLSIGSDITPGRFYEVIKTSPTLILVRDDADDLTPRFTNRFSLFRKQDDYVKVTDREPREGDYIKFNDDFVAGISRLTTGKYYRIIEIDEYGYPQILDDEEDTFDTYYADYDVYERVGAFEVGDYIVPLPEADHHYRITNTDMKLAKVVKGGERRINLEVIAHNDELRIGNIHGAYSVHFRKATPEEVEKYTAPKLKVGDYVRITGNDVHGSLGEHGFKIGEVVRVLALPEDLTHTDRIKGENLDGSKYGYVHVNDFVKASSEEVAEAKRAAKWAKLGRKPNEFKQGDIVIDKHFGLCEVAEVEPAGFCDADRGLTTTNGKWTYKHHCTLVAPVEQRVDRDGAAK